MAEAPNNIEQLQQAEQVADSLAAYQRISYDDAILAHLQEANPPLLAQFIESQEESVLKQVDAEVAKWEMVVLAREIKAEEGTFNGMLREHGFDPATCKVEIQGTQVNFTLPCPGKPLLVKSVSLHEKTSDEWLLDGVPYTPSVVNEEWGTLEEVLEDARQITEALKKVETKEWISTQENPFSFNQANILSFNTGSGLKVLGWGGFTNTFEAVNLGRMTQRLNERYRALTGKGAAPEAPAAAVVTAAPVSTDAAPTTLSESAPAVKKPDVAPTAAPVTLSESAPTTATHTAPEAAPENPMDYRKDAAEHFAKYMKLVVGTDHQATFDTNGDKEAEQAIRIQDLYGTHPERVFTSSRYRNMTFVYNKDGAQGASWYDKENSGQRLALRSGDVLTDVTPTDEVTPPAPVKVVAASVEAAPVKPTMSEKDARDLVGKIEATKREVDELQRERDRVADRTIVLLPEQQQKRLAELDKQMLEKSKLVVESIAKLEGSEILGTDSEPVPTFYANLDEHYEPILRDEKTRIASLEPAPVTPAGPDASGPAVASGEGPAVAPKAASDDGKGKAAPAVEVVADAAE